MTRQCLRGDEIVYKNRTKNFQIRLQAGTYCKPVVTEAVASFNESASKSHFKLQHFAQAGIFRERIFIERLFFSKISIQKKFSLC